MPIDESQASRQTHEKRPKVVFSDGSSVFDVSGEASVSTMCEVLANEQRRRVLTVLATASLPIDVEALARSLATEEAGTPADPTEERIERIHVSLYHNHLPKLAEVGYIDYDAADGTVRGLSIAHETVDAGGC